MSGKTGSGPLQQKTLKNRKIAFIISSLMTAAALGVLPIPGTSGQQYVQAQNFGQRTIQGKVLGESDSSVAGATVFLQNVKTRGIKSFTSTPDGSFRFAQVGMVDDYEVWAEKGKKKSSVKSVSSFDTRKELNFDLKLK